jgi:orotate phosphoribosyltransferase
MSCPALERSDPRWKLLHSLIAEHSLHRGVFVLSSGRQSNFHFQLGQTLDELVSLLKTLDREVARAMELENEKAA